MERLQRLAARAAALALLFCLLAAVAPAARADAGDYDQINDYTVTVDLRADGSADITYDIDWQVIGGGPGDTLTWVQVGLANRHVDEMDILTPHTIESLSLETEGGAWARVDLTQPYFAPDVAQLLGLPDRVQFAFRVHQSHLFTLNDDGTADFTFTPGWFEDLNVLHMTVRWRGSAGFTADNTGTDGAYLTWEAGPLDHGEAVTVHVTVPVTAAEGYDPALARQPGDDNGNGRIFAYLMVCLVIVLCLLAVILILAAAAPRWRGGLGGLDAGDWLWYSNGVHTIRCAHGVAPPAGYHAAKAPAAFRAGGGHTRGGGAGRRSGGGFSSCASSCACACASSCACACACAGGGRAGCSAKNFYRVTLPAARPDTTEGSD